MERQNVTLSIPKEILIKAKHIAVSRRTSLSGLLTKTLEEIVSGEEGYRQACERQLKALEEGMNLGLEGAVEWTREEIHER